MSGSCKYDKISFWRLCYVIMTKEDYVDGPNLII